VKLSPPEPIFQLEEPYKDRTIEFELIETDPNSAIENPNSETNLISDRNNLARDENEMDQGNTPWSEGDFDDKNYQPEIQPQTETEPGREILKDILKDSDLAGLLKPDEELSLEEYFQKTETDPKISYENLLSSAPDFGGISFNTYDWEFAPYLLAMKRKISDKINPPYAFTHMGIIEGDSIIRFIVNQNGSVREIEILDSKGHSSLTTTSRTAIELSDPFMPLPNDFPEEYLEVTAKFAYIIRKNR